MRYFYIFISLFFLSCENQNIQTDNRDNFYNNTSNITQETAWICHNLESEHHGKECFLSGHPEPCLERGNQTKFCWLLYISDCLEDENSQNIEFCKKLF